MHDQNPSNVTIHTAHTCEEGPTLDVDGRRGAQDPTVIPQLHPGRYVVGQRGRTAMAHNPPRSMGMAMLGPLDNTDGLATRE